MNFTCPATWQSILEPELQKPYFEEVVSTIAQEQQQGIVHYPPQQHVLAAFALCPLPSVKVVILGQDPYHNPGEAHGLAFSVPTGIKIPPSLVNIFKELHADLGIAPCIHGNLEHWARQGVLMLNASLTVRAHEPASHSKIGWQVFTNAILQAVSVEHSHVVFLLWGKHAQSCIPLIQNAHHHLLLQAAHPSPLSAYRGFFGCKHFSKTNAYLEQHNKKAIDWRVP
jgi:uracil-DNA glycosylase